MHRRFAGHDIQRDVLHNSASGILAVRGAGKQDVTIPSIRLELKHAFNFWLTLLQNATLVFMTRATT